MATIMQRKQRDGTARWTALVRLKHFKPVTKTFGSAKLAEVWAEQMETALTAERLGSKPQPDVSVLTLEGLQHAYLRDPDTCALASYEDIRRVVQGFCREFGQTRVLDLQKSHIRAWRDRLAKTHAIAGVNRKMAVVRSMWNWGRAAGLIPDARTWPIRIMLKGAKGRERFLNDQELARLLASAKADPLMHALLTVAASTGMRRSELLRMDWSHVDFERQTVAIFKNKTKRPRGVYLAPAAIEALKGLGSAGKVSAIRLGPVWVNDKGVALNTSSIGKRFRAIRKAAGLDDFKLHDMRHSCASWLAQSGASLYQIGSVLGHTSPATTQRYSHLIAGVQMPGHKEINAKLIKGAKP